jgi:hypothetical protein
LTPVFLAAAALNLHRQDVLQYSRRSFNPGLSAVLSHRAVRGIAGDADENAADVN